jgi:hypothetical protein
MSSNLSSRIAWALFATASIFTLVMQLITLFARSEPASLFDLLGSLILILLVITVISTLAIAVLFNPLRKRIQDFIDRRFYRRKYDAEQTLADFAAAARSETDLAQLTSRLTGAIQATLQPEQVSLWLRPSTRQVTKWQS